jgi:hypothetical protein
MGITQSIIGNEHIVRNTEIQDVFTTSDPILGQQRYMTFYPGVKGKIQSSEEFEGGILLLIVTERDNSTQPQILRLSHNMQSLANISPDKIFIPMIVDGSPEIAHLSEIQ